MKSKRLLSLLLPSVAFLFLAACGSDSNSTSATPMADQLFVSSDSAVGEQSSNSAVGPSPFVASSSSNAAPGAKSSSSKQTLSSSSFAEAPSSSGEGSSGTVESSSSNAGQSSSAIGMSSSSTQELPPTEGEAFKKNVPVTTQSNTSTEVSDYSSYNYFGAELTGKDQFTYGRFVARMKMVSIPGSVSSMFLYYDPSYNLGGEVWNEIDVEVLGKNPGEWQSNLITRDPNASGKDDGKLSSEYVTGFGFNATADFHEYVMEWTPEYISWEIDGEVIRRDVAKSGEAMVAANQVTFMTKQQSLRFNLWAHGDPNWVGKFTGAELASGPVEQVIDYVEVYNYDLAAKKFIKAWKDDFDGSSLSSHWSKGNWEIGVVTLSESNVVVEGGYCKLRLTRVHK